MLCFELPKVKMYIAVPPLSPSGNAASVSSPSTSTFDEDAEYRRRRDQNNASSKRSRDKQKQRRDLIFAECAALQTQNAALRARVDHLTNEVADYKKIMLQLMAGGGGRR